MGPLPALPTATHQSSRVLAALKNHFLKPKLGGGVKTVADTWASRRTARGSYRWPRPGYPCPLRIQSGVSGPRLLQTASFGSLAPTVLG